MFILAKPLFTELSEGVQTNRYIINELDNQDALHAEIIDKLKTIYPDNNIIRIEKHDGSKTNFYAIETMPGQDITTISQWFDNYLAGLRHVSFNVIINTTI